MSHINDELEYSIGSNSSFGSKMVRYKESFYRRVDSDPPKVVDENIYLSKLILREVTMENHGVYACVAINYIGLQIREVSLNVLPFEENSSYEERSEPMEFLLLFLLPLGLMLVSLLTWLCYKACFIFWRYVFDWNGGFWEFLSLSILHLDRRRGGRKRGVDKTSILYAGWHSDSRERDRVRRGLHKCAPSSNEASPSRNDISNIAF